MSAERPERHWRRILLAGVLLPLLALARLPGRPLPTFEDSAPTALPLSTDADTLVHLGDDGPPAWFWPNLPGIEATYRRELEVPRRFQLLGLLVGSAGTAIGDSTNTLDIILRDDANRVLLDSANARVGGGEQRGYFALNRTGEEIVLEGGSSLLVDLRSDHPGEEPWPTADDDCHDGGRSWLQAPVAGPDFQLLDRDLNIRALGRWLDGDQTPPELRAADELSWHRQRATLPLRARARDESGIDSVWVESPELPGWSQGLTRLGRAPADSTWHEWSVLLHPAPLVPAELLFLTFEISARDSLGNTSTHATALAIEEAFHWSASGNRADQSWLPDLPLTPGSALALRVPLARIRDESSLLDANVTGARLNASGPGEFKVHLVRESQGRPASSDTGWIDLATPVVIGAGEICPTPLELTFELNALGADQGDAVWLLLDYSLPSQLTTAPGPLLEWFEPDSMGSVDAADSWSYSPLEEQWNPIPAGRLLLEPLLATEACLARSLPLLEAFGTGLAGLECWTESHLAGSTGWRTTSDATSSSTCFSPQNVAYDLEDLTNGTFVFINSDAQGEQGVQSDTLFTPWLHYTDGAVLDFASCLGRAESDDGFVLTRGRSGETPGAWTVALDYYAISDSSAIRQCSGYPHAAWSRSNATLAAAGFSGELQLAFVYQGQYGDGWAIDSVRVTSAVASGPPWDGPQTAAAEIGRVFPNPFNPETVIPYRLRHGGPARLEVFNLRGQRVAVLVDEPFHHAGVFRAVFRPGDLASGLYFARLEAAGVVDTRRLVYLK